MHLNLKNSVKTQKIQNEINIKIISTYHLKHIFIIMKVFFRTLEKRHYFKTQPKWAKNYYYKFITLKS